MTSPANLFCNRFPDGKALVSFLGFHPCIKDDYLNEKGATKAVVKLAVERFANRPFDENSLQADVEREVALIVLDLQRGEDGYSGTSIPKIEGVSRDLWTIFSKQLINALVSCAKAATLQAKL